VLTGEDLLRQVVTVLVGVMPDAGKILRDAQVRLRGDMETVEKVHTGTVPLSTGDIAEAAYWVASLPAHVNINFLEIMPTCQGYGPLTIKRKG